MVEINKELYQKLYEDKKLKYACRPDNYMLDWFDTYKHWLESPIIDLGCGRGEFVELLKARGYEVTGIDQIDLNNDMLIGDITKPLANMYENKTATCFEVFEHIIDDELIGLLENLSKCDKQIISINIDSSYQSNYKIDLHINIKSFIEWESFINKYLTVYEFSPMTYLNSRIFYCKKQEFGDYTIITVTGDRPTAFKMCVDHVAKQTLLPKQWIIVDDGKEPYKKDLYKKYLPIGIEITYVRREPQENDPKHTITINNLTAIDYIKYDKIIIFEDDDYYSRDYCKWAYNKLNKHDLVGQINNRVYHTTGRYFTFNNIDHSSLACTAFNKNILPIFKDICSDLNRPSIDLYLWRKTNKFNINKNLDPNQNNFISMKGMPGRSGQFITHNPDIYKYLNDTIQFDVAKEWYKDDFDKYIGIINYDPNTTKEFIIKQIPRNVRIIQNHDGTITLTRSNKQAEKILDRLYTRCKHDLRWFPKTISIKGIEELIDKFNGKPCYIIGKGPSLDKISEKDFNFDYPIICINESIHKIETLKLDNFIIGHQQDAYLKNTCKPEYSAILLPEALEYWYADYLNKYLYRKADYKFNRSNLTVLMSMAIAKRLGTIKFILLAFDSCIDGNIEYAKCVGYLPIKGGDPKRFLGHKKRIIEYAENIPVEFQLIL